MYCIKFLQIPACISANFNIDIGMQYLIYVADFLEIFIKNLQSCQKSKMVEQNGSLYSKLWSRMEDFLIFDFFIRKNKTYLQNSCQTFLLINKVFIYLKSSYKIMEESKFEDFQIYFISDLSLQRTIEIANQSQILNFHQSCQKMSYLQEFEKF